MWKIITKFFANMGRSWVTKPISTLVSVAFMWAFHGLVNLFPAQAAMLQKVIVNTYYNPPKEWAGFLSQYIERMTGMKISIEDIARQGAGIGARSFMTSLGEKFLSPMLGLIMPTPQEIKTNPLGGANRFMSTNLQFQLSAWLLHVLGDMQSFGMFKSLKDLPNAISWSYGIGWLSWLVMGPPFRAGIAAPMEKLFARMYTPELLTQAQAASAARHGLISYEQYLDFCLDRGLHPAKAAMLYELGEKELTDSWMRKLAEMGWLDEEEIKQELTRRGYSPERSVVLARLIRDDRKLSLIDKVITAAEELYKDGLLDKSKLTEYLKLVGYGSEEIELKFVQLEAENSRRRFLTPAQVIQAWKQNHIDRVYCKDYLVNRLHYTPEDAELYMKLKT